MSDDRPQKKTWRDSVDRVRARLRLSPAQRRAAVIAAVVVGVVTALVIVPGFIASQPDFMKRYTNMDAEYATWSTSVHAQVACSRCHVPPRATAQLGHRVRMLGEFYVSVVSRGRQPKLLSTPTNEACASCHIDLRTVSPSGDLNIPHRAHVNVLKLKCVKCHGYLVHLSNPEKKHTPRMVTCLSCHDGKQAKNACSTCHTDKAAPVSHRAKDWVVVHPDKQKETDCTKCHKWTDKWCAECHSRRPRSHGDKWRSKHRFQVEAHRNCEACHKAAFCVRCHGEVPKKNLDPALTLVQ
ncbi:MAG: hypothetical protein HY876_02305 [Coriobacteriales bacterium]|nr:hypothetical protein [Coriobacteriales bacterium]